MVKGAAFCKQQASHIFSDDTPDRSRRTLALSLVASTAFNLALWMLAAAIAGWSLKIPLRVKQHEREFVVSSTSLRIERRTVPRPIHHVAPPQPQKQALQPQHASPQAAAAPARAVRRAAPPRELAREVPQAPPQPQHRPRPAKASSLQAQLAREEREFAREAQTLRESRAPLSIATITPQQPSTFRRTLLDESGGRPRESIDAILVPLPGKHWLANGLSCYYVHYYATYSTGGSEDGNIPWPVCYPAAHDAMLPLNRVHQLPIPEPPVGYVLPPGTALGPLLNAIYTGSIRQQ